MMTYELDDTEKEVLLGKVVERARADLNDGRPLTEMIAMTKGDIETLKQIWEHFDGIADGAPDAPYASKMALQFCEPLAAIIASAEHGFSPEVSKEIERDTARGLWIKPAENGVYAEDEEFML